MLNRDGVVTALFFEQAYQERTTVSTIMIALGNAKTPAAATATLGLLQRLVLRLHGTEIERPSLWS
jgi:hypothetical protein